MSKPDSSLEVIHEGCLALSGFSNFGGEPIPPEITRILGESQVGEMLTKFFIRIWNRRDQADSGSTLDSIARAMRNFASLSPQHSWLFSDDFISAFQEILHGSTNESQPMLANSLTQSLCTTFANLQFTDQEMQVVRTSGITQLLSSCIKRSKGQGEASASIGTLEAALDFLATLAKFDADQILGDDELLSMLLQIVRKSKHGDLKLLASVALVNLIVHGGSIRQQGALCARSISDKFIPCLVDMLDLKPTWSSNSQNDIRQASRIPWLISLLADYSAEYRKILLKSSLLARLTHFFSKAIDALSTSNPKQRAVLEEACEAIMLAIYSLTDAEEEGRLAVFDLKGPVLLMKALDPSTWSPKARLACLTAACRCIRVLSRSAKSLRTVISDLKIENPLINILLLEDDDIGHNDLQQLKSAACSSLSNFALEFAPAKKAVVEKALDHIIALAHGPDMELQFDALWALKNLVYQSDLPLRRKVLQDFGVENLIR